MRLSELDWDYVDERAAHFTGREWVFERLAAFLRGPEGVLLLLGDPGTGKTAVAAQLARVSAGREEALRALPVDAAYFCRAGKVDVLDVAQRLSDQLAESVPQFAHARRASLAPEIQIGEVQIHTGPVASGAAVAGVRIDLGALGPESAFLRGVTLPLKRLREAGDRTPVELMVDALDESLTSPAADALPRLLSAVEHVHLVVTSRKDTRAVGGLQGRAQVIDLVADAPSGSNDVLAYLRHRLDPHGAPGAMRALARRIDGQASGNFLYAFYVVEALISAGGLGGLDEHAVRGVPLPEGGLSGIYREFLGRELGRDGHGWVERFRPVLAAVAVAQDEGLDTDQLARVASQLREQPMSRTAVRDVTGAARQFLDGVHPDGPFRMYHQSFGSFLVDAEHNRDFLIDPVEAHAAFVAAYRPIKPLMWDEYARRNLAVHAASAGQLDGLLDDPQFLLAADPDRLLSALPVAGSNRARAAAKAYQRAYVELSTKPTAERVSYLEFAARCGNAVYLADRLAALNPCRPWSVSWARWEPAGTYRQLGSAPGRIQAIATAEVEGHPVAITAGHSIHVWDLRNGALIRSQPGGSSTFMFTALAVGQIEGRPVVISGNGNGVIQVWNLGDGALQWERKVTNVAGRRNQAGRLRGAAVNALVAGQVEGRPVVISGTENAKIQVCNLIDGSARYAFDVPIKTDKPRRIQYRRQGAVNALAIGDIGGRPHIVASVHGGTVWSWDLHSGTLLWERDVMDAYDEPRFRHGRLIGSVDKLAVSEFDGHAVVLAASTVSSKWLWHPFTQIWTLADGSPIGTLRGPAGGQSKNALAVSSLNGHPVILTGGFRIITVHRLADGSRIGDALRGHEGYVQVVAASAVDGRPVVLSSADDGTSRVWDLADSLSTENIHRIPESRLGDSFTGEFVHHVTCSKLNDRPVVVSSYGGGMSPSVRVWDLANGETIHELQVAGGAITALSMNQTSRGLVVVAGYDFSGTIQAWDLVSGQPIGEPIRAHDSSIGAVAVTDLKGRLIALSSRDADECWNADEAIPNIKDPIVWGWDLESGAEIRLPVRCEHLISAMAMTIVKGQPALVTAELGRQGYRVWDLINHQPVDQPHAGQVTTLAVGVFQERHVIVTSSYTSIIRVWDLETNSLISQPFQGHDGGVAAIAVGELDTHQVIVTGGEDHTIRVWDLTGRCLQVIEVGSSVESISIGQQSCLAVATWSGLVVLKLNPRP